MATKRKKRPARKGARSQSRNKKKNTYGFEITGIVLIAAALLGTFRLGFIGQLIYAISEFFLGTLGYLFLAGMLILGAYLVIARKQPAFFQKRIVGCYLLAIGMATFVEMHFVATFGLTDNILKETWVRATANILHPNAVASIGGGMIGALICAASYFLVAQIGTQVIAILLMLIGISFLSGIPLRTVDGKIASGFRYLFGKSREAATKGKNKAAERQQKRALKMEQKKLEKQEENLKIPEPEKELPAASQSQVEPPIISNFHAKAAPKKEVLSVEADEEVAEEREMMFEQESFENEIYQLPTVDLLTPAPPTDQSKEYDQIKANAAKLESTFESFGVQAKITQVHLGPAVTKYEVQPAIGVKVSRIVSLSDDIALALAAKDIRIEAPIPGKSAIGIEVANQQVAMVSLREVLENNPKNRPEDKLQIALGRDISGEAVLAHLNKMPHLLVAGSTGSGKSVCINGIITSILLRAKPHEVKMMMIDPKMVELNVYNGIPHLLAPVVTNPKKAAQALQKVVSEMERRYELFSHTGTRNMEGYNEHVRRHNEENEEKQPELPFIVVIVDELADLMMVASNDVEDAITRLAQMARAAGIHLIIATQRPSVDVITGVIKANIPSRIAFAVSSATDSRTILDMGGAEKLLGRGDMLFLPVGSSKPTRVQGAFLSDSEVEKIVDFVIAQQKAQYDEEMIPDDLPDVSEEAEDELFSEAVDLVIEMQTASVSMLQRKFRIGYNRAARLIDEMEQRGIVGPHEGSKPRRVNVDLNNLEE
ncbi:FtsK/SpoIIIE family DNA translocase [Listeria ilorinensis]|uniref:FtsK/SpoIIIE family DNA translocase n=1 Tax=Listeria ilorinensis TaxID=2867439 RepID=UPI001EF5796A|nr:DNA translocase FtsK [Listeria ilorinensis]